MHRFLGLVFLVFILGNKESAQMDCHTKARAFINRNMPRIIWKYQENLFDHIGIQKRPKSKNKNIKYKRCLIEKVCNKVAYGVLYTSSIML